MQEIQKFEEINEEFNTEYVSRPEDLGYITTTDGIKLAYLGNINNSPKGLRFLTVNEDFIQCASFRYDAQHVMNAHRHIERKPPETFRSEEVLLVWKGSVRVCIISDDKGLDTKNRKVYRTMKAGDYIVVFKGGVGYKVLEDDTLMMEMKNGPFNNSEEDRVLL